MKHTLRNWLAICLIGVMLISCANADSGDATTGNKPIVFSAGLQNRGYWGVAERLQKVAKESGVEVKILESQGSVQNLQRLDDPGSPVNLGLTQADALKHYLREKSGLAARMEILESIGKECVFIIASTQSGIRSDADLQQDRGYRIAIQSPDSGVAVTFAYMQLLEPKLRNTTVVYMDTEQAIRGMHAANDTKVDAVMLVQRPKVRTPEIRLALENSKDYQFVTIEDRDLNDRLPNGEKVYNFMNIPLLRSNWANGKSVKTICTKGLLISVPDKLSGAQRDSLKRFIDYHWMRIYPTER